MGICQQEVNHALLLAAQDSFFQHNLYEFVFEMTRVNFEVQQSTFSQGKRQFGVKCSTGRRQRILSRKGLGPGDHSKQGTQDQKGDERAGTTQLFPPSTESLLDLSCKMNHFFCSSLDTFSKVFRGCLWNENSHSF